MFRQSIHHNRKRENVTARGEKEEQQLAQFENVATNLAHQDFACVGHTVDEGVFLPKLTDQIAGVCRDETEANDEDDRSIDY